MEYSKQVAKATRRTEEIKTTRKWTLPNANMPKVTLTFDLHNPIKLSVGANKYSL